MTRGREGRGTSSEEMVSAAPQRIAIVGSTGTGKTTLAELLSTRLGIRHIELDALHWGPDWAAPPVDEFRQRVAEALAGDRWIADGNYGKAQDIIWSRADTLVWLDYPLRIALWRLLWRTLDRVTGRKELWHGNRETWREAFWARDNLFRHAITTHRRRRSRYQDRLRNPAFRHLHVVRLANPKATERWVASLSL